MVTHYAHHVIRTTKEEWHPSAKELAALNQKAEELWPDSLPFAEENRIRWVEAVKTVRSTTGGWVLDSNSAPRKY